MYAFDPTDTYVPYSPTNPIDPDAPADLISALLAPASTLTVNNFTNIDVNTSILSTFFYNGSISELGIGAGLLLTSGVEPGPFNSDSGFGGDNGQPGDSQFDTVVPGKSSYNATTISFDLTIGSPQINAIQFDVVFGSEEYPEYVNSYPDIGAVFVNGTNYALFNGNPDNPLSVLSSNLNAGNFNNNSLTQYAPIEYDGLSGRLTIIAPVTQGVNHITIGIADLGDPVLDSGMFISNLTGIFNSGDGGLVDNIDGDDEDNDIDGNDNDNQINAGDGDDEADGGKGDDILNGGEGDDDLTGGEDDDEINGDGGSDKAHFSGNRADYEIVFDEATGYLIVTDLRDGSPDGTDKVGPSTEFLVFADGAFSFLDFVPDDADPEEPPVTDTPTAGDDHIVVGDGGGTAKGLFGDDIIDGGDGDDDLDGNQGDDTIDGADGDDILHGRDGEDVLIGGDGNDQLDGGLNDDDLSGGNGNDKLNGQEGDDEIDGGSGDDQISGGTGDDVIRGGTGNDKIVAGDGDDVIIGGPGNDDTYGGAGADVFVFNAADEGFDKIRDFVSGTDLVVLDGSFGLDPLVEGTNLIIGAGATAGAAVPTLLYNQTTGVLAYDADGSGAGGALAIAVFYGRPALEAGDFALSIPAEYGVI